MQNRTIATQFWTCFTSHLFVVVGNMLWKVTDNRCLLTANSASYGTERNLCYSIVICVGYRDEGRADIAFLGIALHFAV